jgi:hypothetical protein
VLPVVKLFFSISLEALLRVTARKVKKAGSCVEEF